MNQSDGENVEPPWTVLGIMGSSGTGKSSAAKSIARRFAVPWIQVDDLRLAIESMNVSLSHNSDKLNFFGREEDVWRRPVDEVQQALIDVAGLLVPATRIVIGNHLALDEPVVLEGDGLDPALANDPKLRPWIESGALRFCCVAEASERRLFENITARGRSMHSGDTEDHLRQAIVYREFGRWLHQSALRADIPVVESRPFATLPDRIIAAAGSGPGAG